MENSNTKWRTATAHDQVLDLNNMPAEITDWRTQLLPDSRQRIVNKIMETLKRQLTAFGPEGLVELNNIVGRFEEKIYTTATSQSDYLRKISLKMLSMETKSQSTSASDADLVLELNMPEITDWRTELLPDSRLRIVYKIMETLMRHLPISGPEGMVELNDIARRFEEKVYTGATSQSDYLRKISLKMLAMETKPGTSTANYAYSEGGVSSKYYNVNAELSELHLDES